jgi:hypothetical protein
MSNPSEKRAKLLGEFKMAIEQGMFLGSKTTNTQIIHYYKVKTKYAILYYSTINKTAESIEWCDSLAEKHKKAITYKRQN